jgi:AcrR family transcriptional regulator
MTRTAVDTRKNQAPRLNRDDWLDAAYEVVAESGFDAVRVLSIADTLKVTRGSFYWHFIDHADLIAALLQRWQSREIEADKRLQADATDDPEADLVRLLDTALAYGGSDLKALRFEQALRSLGRRDPKAAEMLAEVDAVRLAVLEEKFLRLTGDTRTASELAALIYLAVAGGLQALARPGSDDRVAAYLRRVIADYLIHRQTPGAGSSLAT